MNKTNLVLKIEKFINIDELIFDFSIFTIFFFISYLLKDYNGRLTDALSSESVIAVFIVMELFSPWYLGEIYTRYRDLGKTADVYKTLSVIVLLAGLTISALICFYIPYIYISKVEPSGVVIIYFLSNFIFGTVSIIIGWEYGTKYREIRKDGKEISNGLFNITYPLVFVLAPFLLIGYIYKSSLASFLLILLGISAVFNLKKIADKFFHRRIVRLYLFPFILCFVIELSQVVMFEIQDNGGNSTYYSGMDFPITAVILIIIRIMLLFAPPFRLISFAMGTASMIAYVLFLKGVPI